MKRKFLLFCSAAFLLQSSVHAQTAFPNGSMENWRDISGSSSTALSLTAPNDWYGIDSLIAGLAPMGALMGVNITPQKMLYKSPDFYEGSFSAMVETKKLGDSIGNIGGMLTNAVIGINLAVVMGGGDILDAITYSGGTNVSGNVEKVNAWVKTSSTNTDNATISVMAVKGSGDGQVVVAQGDAVVANTVNSFTNMEVTLSQVLPGEVPERLIVFFSSSDMQDSVRTEGNTLYVDKVSYTMATTGVTKVLQEDQVLAVYPNPSSNVVNFKLAANQIPEQFKLTVSDVQGRVLATQALTGEITTIDVSSFAPGVYFYTLTGQRATQTESGKFLVR